MTRESLVATARRVFLRRGFHASSLEEIALEAGVTKGAVYSNFTSKAELFLAVLDDHIEERLRVYATTLPQRSLEAVARTQARFLLSRGTQETRRVSLLMEVWIHAAADDPSLRSALLQRHDRMLDDFIPLLEKIFEASNVEPILPTREAARVVGVLVRGMLLERLLDPSRPSDAQFETALTACICGLTRPSTRTTDR